MNNELVKNIHWWEKRRPIYLAVLLMSSVGMMLVLQDMTISYGIFDAIIGTIGYLVIANVFYSLGWMLPILCDFYFKIHRTLVYTRLFQLIIGCVITIFITAITYRAELYYAFINSKY